MEYDLDKVLDGVIIFKYGAAYGVRDLLKNTHVLHIYMEKYPDDEMGKRINPDVTFYDLLDGMRNHREPSDIIGVCDSVIRERVFAELAERMGVPSGVIYNLWLNG